MRKSDNVKQDVHEVLVSRALVVEGSDSALSVQSFFDVSRERGASLVEYALLVALIAVVAIAAVSMLGRSVSGQFSVANEHFASGGSGPSEAPIE